MALQIISANKPGEGASSRGSEGLPERLLFMDPKEFKTHPTFEKLLRIEEGLLKKTTEDMRANGFSLSKPVTLAVWKGQDEPVLVDGHMRRQAAIDAGIPHVPYVIEEFPDESAALQFAINCQTQCRVTTDGALYQLCDQFDRLIKCGGDRKSEEAKSEPPCGGFDRMRSVSARKTAHLVGCNFRKVKRIRKVHRDGWPEIREAVRDDEMTINKAYDLIRKMEVGEDEQKITRKLTAGQIKMLNAVYGEEIMTDLEGHGGDLHSHLIAAMQSYLRQLEESGRDKDSERSNRVFQHTSIPEDHGSYNMTVSEEQTTEDNNAEAKDQRYE
jgi:hypothetical protein